MAGKTVSNTTPKAILDACRAKGFESRRLLPGTGVSANVLSSPEGRSSFESVVALWDASYCFTNDRMIGTAAVKCLPFGSFKVIDYLMASSSTTIQALHKALSYYPIINEGFEVIIDEDDKFGFVELHNPDNPKHLPFQYVDFVTACILARIRFANGRNVNPLEVRLTCREPADISGYHRFFQAPFKFKCSVNRRIFKRSSLETPQPNSDPRLAEMLDFHAGELLSGLLLSDDAILEIRDTIRDGLRHGGIKLNECARKLGLSRRSLQRKLNLHGTTYRHLSGRVRCDLARALLSQNDKSIEEIAYLLGFSEKSSFYKAFRRWTGSTPHQFRN